MGLLEIGTAMIAIDEHLLNRLASATHVVFFTGAGMSAESGVPTFRGEDGIWKKLKPEELANFDAFIRNPDMVWEWYKHRKKIMADIVPHKGYEVIARMERMFKDVTVITQNIDNLHRRAGSTNVIELHGNIERNYCIKCGEPYSNQKILESQHVPRCERCGGLVRPDVVWFGENLPEEEWDRAVLSASFTDVFFSIGTSAVVYPAASIPQYARRSGAYCVEINPEPTPLFKMMNSVMTATAGDALVALEEKLSGILSH
jgi:NAD-dependent deacetylase